jgi:DNA-binding NtrC family response regulator
MAWGKIVIANDEEDILEIVVDRLEFYGFKVRGVGNGLECLREVEREVPDLVLLDVRMPVMDGMETLGKLHDAYPQLPVLMVSASADREMVGESLLRGAVGYILKPFEARELKQKVFKALKQEEV